MKTISKIIRQYREKKNLIPFKTVILDTGIICQHYRNGKIEVIWEVHSYITRTEKGMIL